MKISSSKELFEWLFGFINLERGQTPKSFRLDRMEFLAKIASHPERCAPSIHIAGSKGKGSVTGMIAAILTAANLRAARYMSPHIIDIRERICLGNSYFSEDVYCAAGGKLREVIEAISSKGSILKAAAHPSETAYSKNADLFDPETPDGCEPTFWECLTLFFSCVQNTEIVT